MAGLNNNVDAVNICIIIEYARDYCKFICSADSNTYETPDVNFESKPVCSCYNHKFEYSDNASNLIIDHHKLCESFIEQFRNNFNLKPYK